MYPVKVMRIITWLPRGGIERKMVEVLQKLDREKFIPLVCCLKTKEGVYDKELEEAGIKVVKIGLRSRLDPRGIKKLVKVMREEQVKIVHTHMYRANVSGRIAAIIARVPVIIAQIHNLEDWKRWRSLLMDKLLSPFTDKIVTVSEAVKRYNAQKTLIPLNKFTTIYNGVDISFFEEKTDQMETKKSWNILPSDKVVGMVANFYPQKGHQYFLQAAKIILGSHPATTFLIVGKGHLKSKMEKLAKDLHIEGKVIFAGSVEDVRPLYQIMDVSVLPSSKEGFSNVILESMASSLPVIASRVGGNQEVIIDNQTGYLVPYGSVGQLVEKITMLLKDEKLAQDMGKKGRGRAELFTLERMVQETEKLYDNLLKRKLTPTAKI